MFRRIPDPIDTDLGHELILDPGSRGDVQPERYGPYPLAVAPPARCRTLAALLLRDFEVSRDATTRMWKVCLS
jgi:hypothetical protein